MAIVLFTCFLCVFQEVNFWQIYGGNFVYVKFFRLRKVFRTQGCAGIQSFYFVLKIITISKMCNLSEAKFEQIIMIVTTL